MNNSNNLNLVENYNYAPSVLKWARVKRFGPKIIGLETNIGASFKGLSADTILSWESGKESPTFDEVKKLSELYKRPLAVFFLTEPPAENGNPPDLRTIGSADNAEISPKGLLAIRRARHVQGTFAALSSELGETIKFNYKKFSINDDCEVLAEKIRTDFKLTAKLQSSFREFEELFEYLREKIEDSGALTLKSALSESFSTKDFRAMSFSDAQPFLILINNQDYEGAKNFSLMHEFAHILVRESGLCNNFKSFDFRGEHTKRIEVFCNKFAANFLVPMDEFLSSKSLNGAKQVNSEELDSLTKKLASEFKVSRVVVLRRLLTAGLINQNSYEAKTKDWDRSIYPPRKAGGQYSLVTILKKNGKKFSNLILEAYRQNKISYSSISENLGIRRKNTSKFSELLRSHAK